MNQQIRFCTSHDGARIAYAISGQGTPVVMSATWITHLEHQWRSPAWEPWLRHLSSRHTLIRYDSRGCGLSDRGVEHHAFEDWIRDFEHVVDAAGFPKVSLVGTCQGGPIAVEYAARHPERVDRLVLYGSYARGMARRPGSAEQVERARVLMDMLRLGWGDENHAFIRVWAGLFQADGDMAHVSSWSDLQRVSTSAELAARLAEISFNVDVQDSARRVRCPTLVVSAERDTLVPCDEGRRLANLIPGARFVSLDTRNHMLLADEPAWHRLVSEMEAFLEEAPRAHPEAMQMRFATLTPRERQVLEEIARGRDNAEIAACLALSEKTVRNHVTRVFDKIGVMHRYQAIVMARDAGFGRETAAAASP